MTETIQIKKLGRKPMPSKFEEGQTYSMTQVIDAKNRKMTGFGSWTENWKVGDEISVNVTKSDYTDKNGITKISLKLENPNPSSQQRGQQNDPNKISHINQLGWEIASNLASTLFSNRKSVTLNDIEGLVDAIKLKLDPSKKSVPEIDVNLEDNTDEIETKFEKALNSEKLDGDFEKEDDGETPF